MSAEQVVGRPAAVHRNIKFTGQDMADLSPIQDNIMTDVRMRRPGKDSTQEMKT